MTPIENIYDLPIQELVVFKARRGSKEFMLNRDPILRKGEFFIELDYDNDNDTGVLNGGKAGKGKIKVGDGETIYSRLPYLIDPENCDVRDLPNEPLKFDTDDTSFDFPKGDIDDHGNDIEGDFDTIMSVYNRLTSESGLGQLMTTIKLTFLHVIKKMRRTQKDYIKRLSVLKEHVRTDYVSYKYLLDIDKIDDAKAALPYTYVNDENELTKRTKGVPIKLTTYDDHIKAYVEDFFASKIMYNKLRETVNDIAENYVRYAEGYEPSAVTSGIVDGTMIRVAYINGYKIATVDSVLSMKISKSGANPRYLNNSDEYVPTLGRMVKALPKINNHDATSYSSDTTIYVPTVDKSLKSTEAEEKIVEVLKANVNAGPSWQRADELRVAYALEANKAMYDWNGNKLTEVLSASSLNNVLMTSSHFRYHGSWKIYSKRIPRLKSNGEFDLTKANLYRWNREPVKDITFIDFASLKPDKNSEVINCTNIILLVIVKAGLTVLQNMSKTNTAIRNCAPVTATFDKDGKLISTSPISGTTVPVNTTIYDPCDLPDGPSNWKDNEPDVLGIYFVGCTVRNTTSGIKYRVKYGPAGDKAINLGQKKFTDRIQFSPANNKDGDGKFYIQLKRGNSYTTVKDGATVTTEESTGKGRWGQVSIWEFYTTNNIFESFEFGDDTSDQDEADD